MSIVFERFAAERKSSEWLAARAVTNNSRYLVLNSHGDLFLNGQEDPEKLFFSKQEVRSYFPETHMEIFLGSEGSHNYYCLGVSEPIDMREPVNPREIISQFSDWLVDLINMARGIVLWRANVNFCGRCGSATKEADGGMAVTCLTANCSAKHYPKIDPAVIVLVSDGKEHVALARGKRHKSNMFSCFAGFLELGESLEQAITREIQEESGLNVSDIQYFGSQSWPYPSSVMIGYSAVSEYEDLTIDQNELVEGYWFSRSELSVSLRAGRMSIPPISSIAGRMIRHWLGSQSDES
ncbi:MAG: NAD(+) diphosphatase [Chloroflexi bacterium]|nr:NAD(+) diphosphatase [Chloroflexota bacterium]|tara:strand:- start:881 stop:1765 length:885 start_codon:yes stop_codon:yes gene_type:complete